MMELKRLATAMVGHFLASLLYVLRRLRVINTVVDTSSILDHREELKELWEKRMMADENLSSPSSAADEKRKEEGCEEKVVKTKSETPKQANGSVHDASESHSILTHNEFEPEPSKNREGEEPCIKDSLEDLNANEYAEEKTFTSELETSLVMKHVTQVVTEAQTIVEMVTGEIHSQKSFEILDSDSKTNLVDLSEAEAHVPVATEEIKAADFKSDIAAESVAENLISIEDDIVLPSENLASVPAVDENSKSKSHLDELAQENVPSPDSADSKENDIELDIKDTDEDDGFVRVGECLPRSEEIEDDQSATDDASITPSIESKSFPVLNGFSSPTITPEPRGDVTQDPEMEQFVKSGGLKRLLVAKTEQPYNACDTETKIAIEIREMREREEELRVMREQHRHSPVPPKTPSPAPREQTATPRLTSPVPAPTTGYRVSSVFGSSRGGSTSPGSLFEEERKKSKETAVEKEIRLARDREEELRKQKGLPPREDDSYVKPSQVKSSQVRVFGKAVSNSQAVRNAATAKIQLEIEEQTQREMALRETGSIQTISQERTDAKVAKLNSPDAPVTNGNSHAQNGNAYTNGRSSPDKRTSPSPNGNRPISMHKFIASRGKEAAFAAPRNAPRPTENGGTRPPNAVQLKRTQSVESKIQQEIMEMKQREEELKMRNNMNDESPISDENGIELEMNLKNSLDYTNGNYDEELSPRHNKLIAQWEKRIQKAES